MNYIQLQSILSKIAYVHPAYHDQLIRMPIAEMLDKVTEWKEASEGLMKTKLVNRVGAWFANLEYDNPD